MVRQLMMMIQLEVCVEGSRQRLGSRLSQFGRSHFEGQGGSNNTRQREPHRRRASRHRRLRRDIEHHEGSLGNKYWPQEVPFDVQRPRLAGLEWLVEDPEGRKVFLIEGVLKAIVWAIALSW